MTNRPYEKLAKAAAAAANIRTDEADEYGPIIEGQPAWVPDWVWGAYRQGSYSHEGAKALIESQDCATVWATLERRLGTPNRPSAARLFFAVERALDFSGAATMGDAERRKRATAVAKAIETIKRELDETHLRTSRAQAFARSVSTSEAIQEAGFVGSLHLGTVGNGIDAASFEVGARIAAEFMVSEHLTGLLDALALDALTWANEATVLRPSKPTAPRTYFIRKITNFFVASYEEPLRAVTLSLASVFFDCENMTTAEIASVAPAPGAPFN